MAQSKPTLEKDLDLAVLLEVLEGVERDADGIPIRPYARPQQTPYGLSIIEMVPVNEVNQEKK